MCFSLSVYLCLGTRKRVRLLPNPVGAFYGDCKTTKLVLGNESKPVKVRSKSWNGERRASGITRSECPTETGTESTYALRHSIIHCNLPTDHAIIVMADLQKRYDVGYPEAQAEFMWWIGDTYSGNYGRQRSLRILPFKTFVSKGIQWGGRSDYRLLRLPPDTGFGPQLS